MYKSGLFFSFSKMKNLIGFDKRSFLTTGFSALTTAKGIREIRWWDHSKETSRRFYPTTKKKTFCGTGHRLKTNKQSACWTGISQNLQNKVYCTLFLAFCYAL